MPFTNVRRTGYKMVIRRPARRTGIYVRPIRSKYKPSKLAKKIKSISLAQAETKVASVLHTGTNLGHNQTNFSLNLLKSTQSINNNPGNNESGNRIGNEVVARGLKLRVQLINNLTESNVTYKWYLFRYPSGKQMTDADFWVGPSGQGATQNRMIDFVDTREVKILKSGIVRTSGKTANMQQTTSDLTASANRVHSTYFDVWYPMKNRKIKYDGNNSETPRFTDIGFAVVSYDANNTIQGTTLGYLDFTHRFYYKDP